MDDFGGESSFDHRHCVAEGSGWTQTIDATHRKYLRLWGNVNNGIVAGSAMRQHQQSGQNCSTWLPDTGSGASSGFTTGRKAFEQAFEGAAYPNGPYPIQEVNWGNTQTFQQCDGSVQGDGKVAIISPKDEFGYHDNWHRFWDGPDPDRPFALTREHETTVVRYGVNWGEVGLAQSAVGSCNQSREPPESPGNWERTDRLYEEFTGYEPCGGPRIDPSSTEPEIKPILLAGGGAPAPHARWWCDADDPQTFGCQANTCTRTSPRGSNLAAIAPGGAANVDFRGFVRNIADRYGAHARGIEILNEPNYKKFWGDCPADPVRYERLLQYGHDGIRASNHPWTLIILGSMSPENEGASGNADWINYLTQVFASPVDDPVPTLFNVMGLHPYRSDWDRDHGASYAEAAIDDVAEARDLLSTIPDPNNPNQIGIGKPVWVTEVGVFVGPPPGQGEEADPKWVPTEDTQATVLRNIYQGLRNDAQVPVIQLYQLADTNQGSNPRNYGVLRGIDVAPPLVQKRSYNCLSVTRGLPSEGTCP
jgi:hypothetical protein